MRGEIINVQSEEFNPKQKRDYSRGGCRECKRRKIKCDETKPECARCKRLCKECSYPEAGEKVLRVSKRYLLQHHQPPVKVDKKVKPLSIEVYSGPNNRKKREKGSKTKIEKSNLSKQLDQVNHIKLKNEFEPDRRLNENQNLNNNNNDDDNTNNNDNNNNDNNNNDNNNINNNNNDINNNDNKFELQQPSVSVTASSLPQPYMGLSQVSMNPTNTSQSGLFEPTNLLSLNEPLIDENDISPVSSLMVDVYNQDDLDLLATDLNHIVNDMMFQSNSNNNHQNYLTNNHDSNNNNQNHHNINNNNNNNTINTITTPNNHNSDLFNSLLESTKYEDDFQKISKYHGIPHEILNVTTPDEQKYLQSFYLVFGMQIMPLGSYDNYHRCYRNPIRDTLLKYACREPFLLAAILAQGAKSTYDRQNHLQNHQKAYYFYLTQCLNLLGPALSQNQQKKVKYDLISNIESILLTVLLLTSANASINQNWRPHLKGAKDIVLKATNSKIRQSKTLILCKVWFTDFEILAGTSSRIGGTLTTDFELDSIINFNDYEIAVLKNYGIIQPNGFCIMFGYNIECANLFRDLIKILNRKRLEGDKFIANDAFQYLNLVGEFNKFYNTFYINKECQLSPNYINNIPSQELPNLIDVLDDGQTKSIISLMDFCQQAYCLSSIITIFTSILKIPYDMPYIQDLNNKLIGLISFISKYDRLPNQQIRYSFLMIQWPMMIAGMNCIDGEDRLLLLKFFTFSEELGSFSSNYMLKRLKRIWHCRDNGLEEESDDEAELDIVAY